MNQENDKNMTNDSERGSSLTAREGASQTEADTEQWLAVRRERLARERRRNLIIVASVVVVALLVIIFFLWRWRNAAATTEETAVVVSVKVAKVERQPISAQVSAVRTPFSAEEAKG